MSKRSDRKKETSVSASVPSSANSVSSNGDISPPAIIASSTGDEDEIIDGVIHPSIIVNEIRTFLHLLSGSGSQKRKVVVALFDFHCCYVFQSVALKGYHTVIDRLAMCHSNFEEAFESLPNSPVWKERLFRHLPGETWPQEYIQYIADTKKDWEEMAQNVDKLSKELKGLLADCEPEERYPILCGFRIRDRSERVRTYVNNTILQSWIDIKNKAEFRDLRDNEFLLRVRKEVYIEYEIELSIENGRKKPDPEEYTNSRKLAAEQNFDGKWYPKEWLTFLLISRPAGKHCTKIFNHPNPSSNPKRISMSKAAASKTPTPANNAAVEVEAVEKPSDNFDDTVSDRNTFLNGIDDSTLAHRASAASLSSFIGQKRPAFHRLLASDEIAATSSNFQTIKDGSEDLAAINSIVQSLEKQKALCFEKIHEIDQKLIKYYRLQEEEAELFLSRKMQKTHHPSTSALNGHTSQTKSNSSSSSSSSNR